MDKSTNIAAEDTFFEQFRSHPESVGENYWTHMLFAFRFSLRMFGAGFAALIHGVAPPLFCSTGSDTIKAMHADLTKRHS